MFAQSVAAMAEIEAMKIENKRSEMKGEFPQYGKVEFLAVIDKYGLGHNTLLVQLLGH